MAKKGGMPVFATADDYIKSRSEEAQVLLKELQSLIKETVPESKEIPNSKVPSYTLVSDAEPKLQIMMAAYAKYVSFYPFESTVEHFSQDLKEYDLGKGTVKFPFKKDLPHDLIKKMILYRKDELLRSNSI